MIIYFKIVSHTVNLSIVLVCRGINWVLSALVFNIFPTIFEVGLVTGILVSI